MSGTAPSTKLGLSQASGCLRQGAPSRARPASLPDQGQKGVRAPGRARLEPRRLYGSVHIYIYIYI